METPNPDAAPLFSVEDLSVEIYSHGEWQRVIDGAAFSVAPGEVLGIVGESASGKSLMAMGAVNLLSSGARVVSAQTSFAGIRLNELPDVAWQRLVGLGIGVLFQDPIAAWDPTMVIGEQSAEVLEEHTDMGRDEIRHRVLDALGDVRLPKAARYISFAGEMSRGEAQRAMLAAALLTGPQLLIADEPLSGLDPTIGRAVMELIMDMCRRRGMAMILVTHDLGVIAGTADRVAVVYGGRIVEEAPVDQIFRAPLHPYTEGLLGSLPWARSERLRPIPGDPPELVFLPPGCPFAPRCRYAEPRCVRELPEPIEIGPARVRCLRAWDLDLKGVS